MVFLPEPATCRNESTSEKETMPSGTRFRKFLFLASFFLLPLFLFSQDTATHRKPLLKPFSGYMKDTIVPAGPNEFAFNLAPFFTTMLGASPNDEFRTSLFYKRQLGHPRNYLRVGVMYKPGMPANIDSDDIIFTLTDSTRYRNAFEVNRKRPLQFNLGLERRSKGSWRWQTYAALDIMYGFYNRKYELTDYSEKLDTSGTWQIDFSSQQPKLVLDSKTTSNWYFGASPAIGLRYAFNRRWLLSLQTGMDAYVFHGEEYKRASSSQGYSLESKKLSYSEFTTTGLFNEFALTFRF